MTNNKYFDKLEEILKNNILNFPFDEKYKIKETTFNNDYLYFLSSIMEIIKRNINRFSKEQENELRLELKEKLFNSCLGKPLENIKNNISVMEICKKIGFLNYSCAKQIKNELINEKKKERDEVILK